MEIKKFYKSNCAPCAMVDNFLKDKGLEYTSVNVEERPDLAAEHNVLFSVPVVILMHDGQEISRTTGFKPEELESILEKYV